MLRVYNKTDNVKLPNGEEKTPDELRSDAFFKTLVEEDCIVDIDDDGYLHWFEKVSSLRVEYGIEDLEDPNAVLAEVTRIRQEAMDRSVIMNVALADIQAQMDALCGIES